MGNRIPISYLQTDKRWSGIDYSAKGESTTIGKAGCGPTCMAMVIASLVDKNVTPVDTAAWAKRNGYKALRQGTYYSYFKPQGEVYNIPVKQINSSNVYGKTSAAAHDTALAAIKEGNWVIACMGKGNWTSSGHFVLWYDIDGNDVLIRDPNSTKATRVRNKLSLFKSQVKYYWIVDVKRFDKEDEEEEMTQDKFNEMMDAYLSQRNEKAVSDWAVKEFGEAKEVGITDGTNPQGFITREQAAIMALRAMKIK